MSSTTSSTRRGVRFTDDVLSSPSSVGTSTGPLTPPSHYHAHIIPLPPVSPVYVPLDIHHLSPRSPQVYVPEPLQLDSSLIHRPGVRPLLWSATRDPNPTELGLPKEYLARPASNPRVARLTVHISGLPYPWAISVQPCSVTSYVTIGDILHCVYRDLRNPVGKTEWNVCSHDLTPSVGDAISAACRQRLARIPDMQGLRRVDFLMDRCMWDGVKLINPGYDAQGKRDGVVLELVMSRR